MLDGWRGWWRGGGLPRGFRRREQCGQHFGSGRTHSRTCRSHGWHVRSQKH